MLKSLAMAVICVATGAAAASALSTNEINPMSQKSAGRACALVSIKNGVFEGALLNRDGSWGAAVSGPIGNWAKTCPDAELLGPEGSLRQLKVAEGMRVDGEDFYSNSKEAPPADSKTAAPSTN